MCDSLQSPQILLLCNLWEERSLYHLQGWASQPAALRNKSPAPASFKSQLQHLATVSSPSMFLLRYQEDLVEIKWWMTRPLINKDLRSLIYSPFSSSEERWVEGEEEQLWENLHVWQGLAQLFRNPSQLCKRPSRTYAPVCDFPFECPLSLQHTSCPDPFLTNRVYKWDCLGNPFISPLPAHCCPSALDWPCSCKFQPFSD